jgi:hypothetical protein
VGLESGWVEVRWGKSITQFLWPSKSASACSRTCLYASSFVTSEAKFEASACTYILLVSPYFQTIVGGLEVLYHCEGLLVLTDFTLEFCEEGKCITKQNFNSPLFSQWHVISKTFGRRSWSFGKILELSSHKVEKI